MATAGRKPKPSEQKRRTGNPGKRALTPTAELVAVAPVDAAAVELTPLAALERSLLAGRHWLAESDAAAISPPHPCFPSILEKPWPHGPLGHCAKQASAI